MIRRIEITITIIFLLFTLVAGVVTAQSSSGAVEAGDTFVYAVSSDSNTGYIPGVVSEPKNTERLEIVITDVNSQNGSVGINCIQYFKNGTQNSYSSSKDPDSYYGFPMIKSNLNSGETIWSSAPNLIVNETILKTYSNGNREINRLSITNSESEPRDIAELFDRTTGMPVELRFVEHSGATTVLELTDSNVWVISGPSAETNPQPSSSSYPTEEPTETVQPSPTIPEFPLFGVVPFLLVVTILIVLRAASSARQSTKIKF
jgi:hypothetical protein